MGVLQASITRREDARPLMTSSPVTDGARIRCLLNLLARVPGPGKQRGRRHSLASCRPSGCGGDRGVAVVRRDRAVGRRSRPGRPCRARPGATRGPADESTYRRAFTRVSADALDLALSAWAWTRAARAEGRLVIFHGPVQGPYPGQLPAGTV
jgi:hypothetical protein